MSKKHSGDKPWRQHIQLGRRKPGQGTPADEPVSDTRKPPGWQGRKDKGKDHRPGAPRPAHQGKPAPVRQAEAKPVEAKSAAPAASAITPPKRTQERPLDGEGRPYITLVQFLKTIDAVDTGGAGKHFVRAGGILVNGSEEIRPGRKLHTGDVVTVAGAEHRVTV